MFSTPLRRAAAIPKRLVDSSLNPYRAKKTWPPDFEKLSPKHQFRLERRYKRRSQLKWARPGWTKAMKLAQWGGITFVLTYAVFFMDWEDEKNPFQGVRVWLKDKTDTFWTTSRAESERRHTSPITSSPSNGSQR